MNSKKLLLLSILFSFVACSQVKKEIVLNGCPSGDTPQEVKLSELRNSENNDSSNRIALTGIDALQILKEGNKRFVEGRASHLHQDQRRRDETSSSQSPHTIILSCSDSRVPPEIIFDQGVGEVFVVRTAGEVPDAAAVASIEYAVEHLGAKALLVMGHLSCGAVKAALETPVGKSAGSKDLNHLIASIRPNIKGISKDSAGVGLSKAVEAQVNGVLKGLEKRSKIISHAIHNHHLEVARAVYNLSTGEVKFW